MSDFITQLKINILSWLLFHANKGSNSDEFYRIKNSLLEEYGVLLGHDLQEIPSKVCYSCAGTGVYRCDYKTPEFCWSCNGSGIYQSGFWTLLEKYYFGTYYFHRPIKKISQKPVDMVVNIKGYIHKTESEYTLVSRLLLAIYFGLDRSTILNGNYINVYWAYKWYWRRNWLRSWLYIFSYKRFPPAVDFINSLKRKNKIEDSEELPF